MAKKTHKEYMKEYYAKNLAKYRQYYLDNKEYYQRKEREWRKTHNREKRIIDMRSYYNNKEKCNERSKDYVRRKRIQVLKAYGGPKPKCKDCGSKDLRLLEIDHIYNDGSKDRRIIGAGGTGFFLWLIRNNFPNKDRYQILCKGCNYLKYWSLTLEQKRSLRCA